MKQQKLDILIVGGGVAGVSAALGARSASSSARIGILSQERSYPYDRTSLSKQVLVDNAGVDEFPILPADGFKAQSIELYQGVTATEVDSQSKVVLASDGKAYSYESLVIATGTVARQFPEDLCQHAIESIYYLRTEVDALNLRHEFGRIRKLVVIGGGLIGLEVAAAAREKNIEVDVLEASSSLLARSCDEFTANTVERFHIEHGVRIHKESLVTRIEKSGMSSVAVKLANGAAIEADLIVVGIGVVPNAQLAAQAGIRTEDGVIVDTLGQTNIPGIYAAGDVARIPLPLTEHSVRLETWRHAQDHGYTVGRNAAGAPEPYRKPPYFWSDQYGHRIQGVGLAIEKGLQTIVREYGDGSHVSFVLGTNETVKAVIGIDCSKDISAARKLIESGVKVPLSKLRDLSLPVVKIVKDILKG